MPMSSLPPPASSPRPRWPILLIGVFLALQIATALSLAHGLAQRSGGFVVQVHNLPGLTGVPVTPEALDGLRGLEQPLVLHSINGQKLEGKLAHPLAATDLIDLAPTARNRFGFVDRLGTTVEVEVPTGMPSLAALVREVPTVLLSTLVALVYFGLGVLVFWMRPNDRAAAPTLLCCLVSSFEMTPQFGFGSVGQAGVLLSAMVFPFYGPTFLNLALHFTGCHERPWPRRVLWASVVGSCALAASLLLPPVLGVAPSSVVRVLVPATGTLLLTTVFTGLTVSLIASRPPLPLGLRRRARFFAIASVVAFLFPSLTLVLPPLPSEAFWGVLICLGSFPVFIAYAIVRHGMFDLRVVLGRGLTYAALSLGVLLAYLGLVFAAGKLLLRAPHSPVAMGVMVALLVLLLSLVQLRVQRALERRLFRRRYEYADALAQASEALTRTRSVDAIVPTVKHALLDAMELSRAAFATLHPERRMLQCTLLGWHPDERTERLPPELPELVEPKRYAPVARALSTRKLATSSDSAAVSAQSATARAAAEPDSHAGRSEATFWQHFGIETIVPLTVSAPSEKRRTVIGLLLLGPRRDERPLDRADHRLLRTLANQLAIAIENAAAFDEIRRLKEGLEDQVRERTRALSTALDDLKQAQAKLVDTEKQALLGRLVAGIVHEVNSPLGVLRSAADTSGRMLARCRQFAETTAAKNDQSARQLVAATAQAETVSSLIRKSTDRLDDLLASLKQFVALDAAKLQAYDVRQGIDSAVTLLSPTFGEGVRIQRDYCDERPLVRCHPAKLNQVFANLLENAGRALGGTGEIRIRVERNDAQVEVQIADDGPGIDPDKLASVFEIGFTQKAGRVGLRMGLPSSKRSIEDLGGKLRIETELGKGTVVRISLPPSAA